MHRLLGLFNASALTVVPSAAVDFSGTMPAGFTYTRPDATTCAMRRDSTGQLQLFTANNGYNDFDLNGVPWGYLSEESRANKCTNYNTVPSGTTGWSTTGTVTVASVADSAAITAFKIGNVVTGNVIELAGGASGGTAVIAGTIGTATNCAASIVARIVSGPDASFGITPTPGAISVTGSAYQRYLAESLLATATSDQLVVTVPAGTTMRVCLNQLELGYNCTSIIKVDGVGRTRAKTFMQHTSYFTSNPAFTVAQGAIVSSIRPQQAVNQAVSQAIFVAGETGTFPQNAFYSQINASVGKSSHWGKGLNVGNNIAPLEGLIAYRKTSVAIAWTNGVEVQGVAGPMIANVVAMTNAATNNFTTLTVGSFASNGGQFNGWIDKIQIFNKRPTLNQLAPYMLGSKVGFNERGAVFAGQSNAEGYTSSATTLLNGGQRAYVSYLDSVWGTSTRNWLINGAKGGTTFHVWDPADPDPATYPTPTALNYWKVTVEAYLKAGGVIDHLVWDQGEADVGNSTTTFKAALGRIFAFMRQFIADRNNGGLRGVMLPVILIPPGKYHFPTTYNDTTNTGAGYWRQAYRELKAENSWIYLAPEKFTNPLYDAIVHLYDSGYAANAPLVARTALAARGETISGGLNGPTWTASASGTTLTIVLTHDTGGSDFTPTTGIEGFSMVDNGSRIATTACVRTNATTITATLASTPTGPAGTRFAEYCNGLLWSDNVANLVRDNSVWQLPLRSGRVALN